MPIAGRVGLFFTVIGSLVLLLYFASAQSGQPIVDYLCSGAGLLVLGTVLMFRFRNPPQPTERFSAWRRWRERRAAKRRGEKQTKE